MADYRQINELYHSYLESSNELYHFGIKGMKWGVRRFQNKDGTLTEEGKQRYYEDIVENKKVDEALKSKEVSDYIKELNNLPHGKEWDNEIVNAYETLKKEKFHEKIFNDQLVSEYWDAVNRDEVDKFGKKLKNVYLDLLKKPGVKEALNTYKKWDEADQKRSELYKNMTDKIITSKIKKKHGTEIGNFKTPEYKQKFSNFVDTLEKKMNLDINIEKYFEGYDKPNKYWFDDGYGFMSPLNRFDVEDRIKLNNLFSGPAPDYMLNRLFDYYWPD